MHSLPDKLFTGPHATFFTFLLVGLVMVFLVWLLLAILIMPMILNRKFNPIFDQRGRKWGPLKGYSSYWYVTLRSLDYATAILFNRYARKEFELEREFFRSKVGKFTVFLCWVYWVTTKVTLTFIALGIVYQLLYELKLI